MKSFNLQENVLFGDKQAKAEPLHVDEHGRILRFALRPGQEVREHSAPHSPVNIIILKGHGLFSGGDGQEQSFGSGEMLLFAPGEQHAIKALDEPLVFLVILHEAPNPDRDKA